MVLRSLFLVFFTLAFAQHFQVNLENTGESHLIILQDTITGLDVGDEVGIFDVNGVLYTVDPGETPEYGEILVGAGVWTGDQLEIVGIMSIDLSQFNGPVLGGAVDGNPILIRAFDISDETEVDVEPIITTGGEYGDLFTVVSELIIVEEEILGCTDLDACNYDDEANTDDGSCNYAEENFDCDGNCLVDTDCAGECGGDATQDCAGECNGDAVNDECGVCDGDDSSCEVYIEIEVTTTVDETELEDMDAFEDNFCSLIETELNLPEGSCDVTNVTISDTRDDVEVTVDFTITLTEEELAETEFEGEEDINEAWEEVEEEIEDGLPEFVYGCTDSDAENYNEEATIDDGSCEYPAQAPEEFAFEQSTLQAFYFMINANIDGESLEFGQDFIAAFNGDVCVGNIAWDGTYTAVPAMGEDGDDWSEGYLLNGDVPTFKIYDASEDSIIDACPETEGSLGFSNNGFIYIDMLVGNQSCTVSYSIPLHYGANLVSFHALPEDVSLGNVMASLGDAVTGVIGEGVAASPNPVLGWVGSLSEIQRTSGYWIKMNDVVDLELSEAIPSDPAISYSMHYGANLISFPIPGSVGLGEGIPDDVEGFFTGVIGEGVAASPNPVLGWVGSLAEFQGTKGYWAKVDDSFEFSFDLSSSSNRFASYNTDSGPYEVIQSTQQAFYFIESSDVDINYGDWILAYNNDVLVGGRQWNGIYTDIPTMGYDQTTSTAGYCQPGDIPNFIRIDASGNAYNLSVDMPDWSNNEIFYVSINSSENIHPSEYKLIQNYPNPFNPSTTIAFSLPLEETVRLNIYDISGRLISTLIDRTLESGYHSTIWDGTDIVGNSVSAGMYIYSLETESITLVNKMILMK